MVNIIIYFRYIINKCRNNVKEPEQIKPKYIIKMIEKDDLNRFNAFSQNTQKNKRDFQNDNPQRKIERNYYCHKKVLAQI